MENEAVTLFNIHSQIRHLSFDKAVCLLNFRDNHLYFHNPIYLRKGYFSYFLSNDMELKFDIDDLFYYAGHRIQKRQGHLFVSDYGMQYSILSRYGIKPYAVTGRDYLFFNGDTHDFRYSNILNINRYHGVFSYEKTVLRIIKFLSILTAITKSETMPAKPALPLLIIKLPILQKHSV